MAEVLKRDIGESIPAFKGKLSRIQKRRSDTNQYGPWSIQNVEVMDGGAKIKVKVWNREEIPGAWLQRTVYLQSGQDDKGKFAGLDMVQDTYDWKEGTPIKKMVEMKCQTGAALDLVDQGQNAPAEPPSPPANAPEASAPGKGAAHAPAAPAAQSAPRPPQSRQESPEDRAARMHKVISESAKFAGRKVCGYWLCYRAVDQMAELRQSQGRPMSNDQIQGMTTSVFIAGDRSGQWDGLPYTLAELEKLFPSPVKSDTK